MTTQPIIESFRKLAPNEKVRLVQELWDEIAQEASRLPLSESHRQLLDQRLQQHEETPDDVELWEKVREDLLKDL